MLVAFQAGHQRQGDSDPNIKASAFGRNFRRRISEAHTPAYKTITLPVSPILSTGPNGILAPPLRERACRRDCAKQSAHMMKQVKKLRTRVSLIKRSLLCSSGQSTQKFQQSAQSREMLRSAQNDAGILKGRYQRSQTALPTFPLTARSATRKIAWNSRPRPL